MPLLRTSNTDLERIYLSDPTEWIDVKRKQGKDDERAIQRLINNARTLDAAGNVTGWETGTLIELASFATLEVVAKKWNVIDPETGRVAPLTGQALRALSDEDLAIVQARLEELYGEPKTEAELKN